MSVHVEATSPDGFITQHQQDANDLFTEDAKAIQIDLRLEKVVKVPVYAVSTVAKIACNSDNDTPKLGFWEISYPKF